ncbi:MAG TPA: hypothetical protein DEP66_05645, partial [Acidimicrobiaceae bacterium]|nr:hypothetical protein [Acidimicrobiaceae bacterium]
MARTELSLRSVLDGDSDDGMCDVFDRCHKIAEYLLAHAGAWLGEGKEWLYGGTAGGEPGEEWLGYDDDA